MSRSFFRALPLCVAAVAAIAFPTSAGAVTSLDARPMLLDDHPFSLPIGKLRAVLTESETGAPIAGKEIVFYRDRLFDKGEREYCRATTNIMGVASCSLPFNEALEAILSFRYEARFEGDADNEPASDTGKLIHLLHLIELF